jgi:ABC-type sugar transport system substrate-binding protein
MLTIRSITLATGLLFTLALGGCAKDETPAKEAAGTMVDVKAGEGPAAGSSRWYDSAEQAAREAAEKAGQGTTKVDPMAPGQADGSQESTAEMTNRQQ